MLKVPPSVRAHVCELAPSREVKIKVMHSTTM